MSLETFTLIHALVSLVGIASGLIVLYGFLTDRRLDPSTAVFLLATALTSLTGFLFSCRAATPTIKLGIISLVALAIAIVTRYVQHLTWRKFTLRWANSRRSQKIFHSRRGSGAVMARVIGGISSDGDANVLDMEAQDVVPTTRPAPEPVLHLNESSGLALR